MTKDWGDRASPKILQLMQQHWKTVGLLECFRAKELELELEGAHRNKYFVTVKKKVKYENIKNFCSNMIDPRLMAVNWYSQSKNYKSTYHLCVRW